MPGNNHVVPAHQPADIRHVKPVPDASFNILFVIIQYVLQIVLQDQHARNAYDTCKKIQQKHLKGNTFNQFHQPVLSAAELP